jgi:hypothetical protein
MEQDPAARPFVAEPDNWDSESQASSVTRNLSASHEPSGNFRPDGPVHNLYEYLQGFRFPATGNLTTYLSWHMYEEGPDLQRIHYATVRCESVSVLRTIC